MIRELQRARPARQDAPVLAPVRPARGDARRPAASSGDACVVIDCDLQDPPELIAEMVARWREGFDVVYAQRRSREGETLAKRIVAAVGYRVIRRIAEVEIPPEHRRFPAHEPPRGRPRRRLNETHGFLRGLVALVGFPQTGVLYDRDPRAGGAGQVQPLLRLARDRDERDRRLLALPAAVISVARPRSLVLRRACFASPTSSSSSPAHVPVGQPDDRDPDLVLQRHPAAQPRRDGRVRRADLRRGQAAAEVHRRVTVGIRPRRHDAAGARPAPRRGRAPNWRSPRLHPRRRPRHAARGR